MQKQTAYADLLAEVTAYLRQGIDLALAAGVSPRALAIDPGIGFGKSVEGNLTLLRHLERLHELGYPVLLGTSRKNFIGRILDQDDPRRRLAGTLATLALAVDKGVQIFRVHDVRAARETLLVAWAIREGRLP
jgi:dihydropteroate synthase